MRRAMRSKPPPLSGVILHLDERGDAALARLLAIDHRMVAEDDALLLQDGQPGRDFSLLQAETPGQFRVGLAGVFAEDVKQAFHARR